MKRFWTEVDARESALAPYFQKTGQLIRLTLELTDQCNNNCVHCYINEDSVRAHQSNKHRLSFDEIRQIAESAVRLEALSVLLTGGEPLLRPDFKDIYMLFKRLGFVVSVFTNATLLNEDWIRLFEEYPPRVLDVSVYGITEETYERVTRVQGSYKRFRHGIELLNQSKVFKGYKAVLVRDNVHEFQEIRSFCREHSDREFRFDTYLNYRVDRDFGRNADIESQRLTPEEVHQIERSTPETVEALREMHRKNSDILEHVREKSEGAEQPLFLCGAGKHVVTISSDGMVRPCGFLVAPRFSFSIREHDLETIHRELMPNALDLQASPYFACGRCDLQSLCDACPATAYLDTGELEGKQEYLCRIASLRSQIVDGTIPALE
ncbi:radical SAM protein [bacterium]|nr:radical SAM protein [bacterium]